MGHSPQWKSRQHGQLAVALLAESSLHVGTGHVVEALSIARIAWEKGIPVELWVNKDTPGRFLSAAPCRVNLIDDFSVSSLRHISRRSRRQECRVVVTNLRRISNSQIEILRENGQRVACVDELGNTKLNCDLVVNPSIVSRYHSYTSVILDFRLCAGPQYLPLAENYSRLGQRARSFSGDIGSVVIAMGGVDRSGATLNIAEHLLDWRPGIPKHIVVGANFMYRRELENFLSRANHPDFITHQDLPSLAQLLFEGDVGFTAGGNTLYELACVGTPALVLYEDPHEMEQGLEFQKKGFGICLGSGVEVTKSQIWGALAKLEKPELRAMFCRRGRSVVDGKGAERVLASLLALASYDSSFQTFP